MRKITIVVALMLAIGVANAQETKIKKFELGGNIGMTTFSNYSALSLSGHERQLLHMERGGLLGILPRQQVARHPCSVCTLQHLCNRSQ